MRLLNILLCASAFVLQLQLARADDRATNSAPPNQSSTNAPPNGPDLTATLTFIRNTLDGYGFGSDPKYGTTDKWALGEVTNSRIHFVWTLLEKDGTTNSISNYDFDLSDIDPSSIRSDKNDSGYYTVTLEATDNAKRVHCTTKWLVNGNVKETRQSKFWFWGFNEVTAGRLVKALSHAATLCGGKPSAF